MKKFIFIGDSITVGTYTKNGDDSPQSIAKPNYATIVCERFGAKCLNYAKNGISFSSTSPVNSLDCVCNAIEKIESGDLLFVAAGTNDFGTNVVLGKDSDEKDISFKGAVEATFAKIKRKFKSETVFVLLPVARFNENENKIGNSLDDYRTILTLKAEKHGFNVIDTRCLPINPSNESDRKNIVYDGVHLNEYGHKLYAETIIKNVQDKKCYIV